MTSAWPWGDWLQENLPFAALLPKQTAQALGALRAAADASMGAAWAAPAQAVQSVVAVARRTLVGRRTTFRFGVHEVALVVTDLEVDADPPALLVGQLGSLRLRARDVAWADHRLTELSVTCRNVCLRPGTTVTLVAAPVEVRATIDREGLRRWLAALPRRLGVRISDDGVARVELARRPGLGHVEVQPRVAGQVLEFAPVALVVLGRRLRGARHLPPLRVPLPDLPRGLHLVGLDVEPGAVSAHAVVVEWLEPLSPAQLGKVVRTLQGGGGVIDVPRHGGDP